MRYGPAMAHKVNTAELPGISAMFRRVQSGAIKRRPPSPAPRVKAPPAPEHLTKPFDTFWLRNWGGNAQVSKPGSNLQLGDFDSKLQRVHRTASGHQVAWRLLALCAGR